MAASFKKDPITTTIGLCLIGVSIFMWIYSYLTGVPEGYEKQWFVPFLIFLLGYILTKGSDRIFKWGDKIIDKTTKQ